MSTKGQTAWAKPGQDLFLNHTPSSTAKELFFYVQHIGHQYCNGDYRIEREGLNSFVLQTTISGKGYLNYMGKNYEIGEGQCMLINCREYQLYYADPRLGWQFKWLHFDGCSSKGYTDLIYDKLGPVIKLEDKHFIGENIDFLIKQILERDINFEINASVVIHKILSQILLSQNSSAYFHSKSINLSVRAVIDFIENNYTTTIKHNQLAKIAGYSEYHLYRIFKDVTGYRPHEYLIKYRINKSKYLLKSSDLSVEQIADKTGFESTCNFITTFKKLEGITPLKFRNSLL